MASPSNDFRRTVPTGSPRRALAYGLTAAFITAFVTCPARYLGFVRSITPRGFYAHWWIPTLLIAGEYAVIVLIAGFSAAMASSGPGLRLPDAATRQHILRAVGISIWTAPLMVLLLERSALTGIVAAGIVISVFVTLGVTHAETAEMGSAPVVNALAAWSGFSISDTRLFVRRLALAIIASALLQAAMLASWIAEREIALSLFVLGAALFAMRLPSSEDVGNPHVANRAGKRVMLSTVFAVGLLVAGLIPLMMPLGGAQRSLDALLLNWSSRTAPVRIVNSRRVRLEQTRIRSDGYIGVILTPRQEVRKELVILPQLDLNKQTGGLPRPLTIRFTGSYWFFQYPFFRPPFDSIVAEGDPANVGVRSSNYQPLLMEAVQTLDEPISAFQLGTVRLAMRDADPDPQTVSIELVLVNTKVWGHPEQSLGAQQLGTAPKIENAGISHYETVTFSVPVNPGFHEFNEIRLIFRLAPARDEHAAAVAVEDFVLVPRGV